MRDPGWAATVGAVAVLYIFFDLSTGRVVGYGDDGAVYAQMARQFDLLQIGKLPLTNSPHGYRFLPSAIAHYLHADPRVAFVWLNAAAAVAFAVASHALLRAYEIGRARSILGVILCLCAWPALRFWIYYPVLTDATGLALLAVCSWAVVARRHVAFVVACALLAAVRENGIVMLLFFILFHANPWNPRRVRDGPPLVRVGRLAPIVTIPLIAFAVVRIWPVFPTPSFDSWQWAADVTIQTLGSGRKQQEWIVASLNTFGLLPWVLVAQFVVRGARLVLLDLRSQLHWVVYVAAAVVLAPLSLTDHERFLVLAVLPLVVASLYSLRDAPNDLLTWSALVGLAGCQLILGHAFAPLTAVRETYLALWAESTSDASHAKLLLVHAFLGPITTAATVALLRTRRPRAEAREGRADRNSNL